MQLAQKTIHAKPGVPGASMVADPKLHEKGATVLNIKNETAQENAYTVRLRCSSPYWQPNWYTLRALDPPAPRGAAAGAVQSASKEPMYGAGYQSVKVYVPRGGECQILIRFNLEDQPDSRAGVYDFSVLVETDIVEPGAARRSRRAPEALPATLYVMPYYRWSIDISPPERRVGRIKKSTEFDLVVTNTSNDWLYCSVQTPSDPKTMEVASPTLRVAVPPAEPGQLLPKRPGAEDQQGVIRAVPIKARTKLKMIKGELTPQPLAITAQRLEAPSCPPVSTDPSLPPLTFVLVESTTDQKILPEQRAMVYNPPIPNKPFEIIGRTFGSLKAAVMFLVGFALLGVILWNGYVWAKEHNDLGVLTLDFKVGHALPGQTVKAEIKPHIAAASRVIDPKNPLLVLQTDANPPETLKWTVDTTSTSMPRIDVTIPSDVKGPTINVRPEFRFSSGLLNLLPFLKIYGADQPIDIDQILPTISSISPNPVKPGVNIKIVGSNFGAVTGKVTLNGNPVTVTSWQAGEVDAQIDPMMKPGEYGVVVADANGKQSAPTVSSNLQVGNGSGQAQANPAAAAVASAVASGDAAGAAAAMAQIPPTPADAPSAAARAGASALTNAPVSQTQAEIRNAKSMSLTRSQLALVLYAEGWTAEAAGNLPDAEKDYAASTQHDNSVMPAWIGLARCLSKDPRYDNDQKALHAVEVTVLSKAWQHTSSNSAQAMITQEANSVGVTDEEVRSGQVSTSNGGQ